MNVIRLSIYSLIAVVLYGGNSIFKPFASNHLEEYAMPPTEEGEFSENIRRDLYLKPPAEYSYKPSAAVVTLATSHTLLDKKTKRTWFGYSPNKDGNSKTAVILFHGSSRTGLSMIDMWDEVARKEELILIAPNAQNGAWNSGKLDPAFLHKLIASAKKNYSIDPDRIFLFGHSSGAIYIQTLANKTIGPWKAVAAHAGYPVLGSITAASSPKPIRHYLGSKDHIFSSDDARAVGKKQAKAGHTVELVIIPEHTHWLYKTGPTIAEDAFKWFEEVVSKQNSKQFQKFSSKSWVLRTGT